MDAHLCKPCVILLRSRVLRGVYVLMKGMGRRLPLVLAIYSTRVNRVIQRRSNFNRSACGNYVTRFEVDKT